MFAFGDLKFYGRENAEARGERYPYSRYTGNLEAQSDPFALFLDQDTRLNELYLKAENEDGYIRDRNVFGEPITIEDTMAVIVRYRNHVLLSYSLITYSPWEGLRVAITGNRGRVELDIVENTTWLKGAAGISKHEPPASTGEFKRTTLRVYPMFGDTYEVEIPKGEGTHGGADPILLEQLFSASPASDVFNRTASHIDGAASILVGIAANQSIEMRRIIRIDDLFQLPEKNNTTLG